MRLLLLLLGRFRCSSDWCLLMNVDLGAFMLVVNSVGFSFSCLLLCFGSVIGGLRDCGLLLVLGLVTCLRVLALLRLVVCG